MLCCHLLIWFDWFPEWSEKSIPTNPSTNWAASKATKGEWNETQSSSYKINHAAQSNSILFNFRYWIKFHLLNWRLWLISCWLSWLKSFIHSFHSFHSFSLIKFFNILSWIAASGNPLAGINQFGLINWNWNSG